MEPTNTSAELLKMLTADVNKIKQTAQHHYTIDELARASGRTVRNIRAYQDRGLLPPPQKRGRTGYYSDVHMARLKIIGQLLDRGFTIANIKDLLSAWERGRELDEILGLELALSSPWNNEAPDYISHHEVLADFGEQMTPALMEKARSLGYLVPEGDRLRVPSPRIYNAAKELAAAGIPLDALMNEVNHVRTQVEHIARGFMRLFVTHLIDNRYGPGELPRGEDISSLTQFLRRIRPLADMVVSAELANILDSTFNDLIVERLGHAISQSDQPPPRSPHLDPEAVPDKPAG